MISRIVSRASQRSRMLATVGQGRTPTWFCMTGGWYITADIRIRISTHSIRYGWSNDTPKYTASA